MRTCLRGVDVVIHAATLHKPHVGTHSRQAFVDTDITGTLTVLEAALDVGVSGVVFSSTTSVFGGALVPAEGQAAAWIDEDVVPVPKNIYGVTKKAAEDLCELFFRSRGLPCVVLRIFRFFPEADDDEARRSQYDDLNLKVNEYLYRRVDLADAVDAHIWRPGGLGRSALAASSSAPPVHSRRTPVSTAHGHAGSGCTALFPDCQELSPPARLADAVRESSGCTSIAGR